MVWALLAILGVPIWLVIGGLGGAIWSRQRFKSQPEVFPVKERSSGSDRWPRSRAYGRVVHDVLVINAGLALVRTEVRGIAAITGVDEAVPEGFVAVFHASFDDGTSVELALDAVGAARLRSAMTDDPSAL